jgi:DNA polymerase III delta prime subunit
VRENKLKELRNIEKARMTNLKTKLSQQDHVMEKFRENWKDDIEERKEV